jgi:hypothetical protein
VLGLRLAVRYSVPMQIYLCRWGGWLHVALLNEEEIQLRERVCLTPGEAADWIELWERRYRVEPEEIHLAADHDMAEIMPARDAVKFWVMN